MFEMYRNQKVTAVYNRVPIGLLSVFRNQFPGKYKIRYRGPRKGDDRSPISMQSNCLKSRATCFSAYQY